MALWGGRFTQAADQRFKQFNDSLRFDYRLAEQDIVGSVAWSKALVTVGVLSAAEQQQLFGVGQKCLGLGRKGLAPLPLAGDIAALHPAVGQQIEQAARPDDGVGQLRFVHISFFNQGRKDTCTLKCT